MRRIGYLYTGIINLYSLMIVLGVGLLLVVAVAGMPFGRNISDEDHPPPDDSYEYDVHMVPLTSHALHNSTLSWSGHVHGHDTKLAVVLKVIGWVVLTIAGVFLTIAVFFCPAFCLWKRKWSSKNPNSSYGPEGAAITEPLVQQETVMMSNASAVAGSGNGNGVVLEDPVKTDNQEHNHNLESQGMVLEVE